MCLATTAYVIYICLRSIYTCAVHVTIFSNGSKFRPVSNFTELHTLTLASRCYALSGGERVNITLKGSMRDNWFLVYSSRHATGSC